MSEQEAVVEVVEPVQAAQTEPAEVVQDQNPSEQATEVKVEEPTNQEKSDLPKPQEKQSRFEKRIAALNRKIGEQQARAEMLERQLNELKPKPEVKSDGLKIEDFDYDVEKYAAAKAEKAREDAIKRYQEENQLNTQKAALKQISDNWETSIAKAEDKYDDFSDVVGELKPTNPITVAIMQAENGADIAYYLAKNISEAHRIAQLDPVTAVREIGKLEVKLLAEPVKTKEPSKAPVPLEPVKGSKPAAKSFLDDDVSQEEFEKMRRKFKSR